MRGKCYDLRGRTKIGNNCFIGERVLLMYGVELADNTIVALESVVTKSFPQGNVIIGENLAKLIGTWDKFAEKYIDNRFNGREDYLKAVKDENDPRFIKRKAYKEN